MNDKANEFRAKWASGNLEGEHTGDDFDELVIGDWFHLERMDTRDWFLQVGPYRVWVVVSRNGEAKVCGENGGEFHAIAFAPSKRKGHALEAAEAEIARLREGAMRAASYVVIWHPPAEPADDDDGGEFSHCALCHADADGRVPDSGPWHEPTCICYAPPQEPAPTPKASP